MIKSQAEKDEFESLIRGRVIYHWGWTDKNGQGHIQCGQVGGNGTTVREFVTCHKCRHVLGEFGMIRARKYRVL